MAIFCVAFVVFGGFIWSFGKLFTPPNEPVAPALAGQTVPAQLYKIDFTKRYDLICSGVGTSSSGNGTLVYHNCRILGFTGVSGKNAQPEYSSYNTDTFDKWVVLELPDKRHAFVPPNAIAAFEEAKIPAKKALK